MGGMLGIGGSAAKTDRGNILSGLQSQWNIFGRGLGLEGQQNQTGQRQQAQGQGNLNDSAQYWKDLLTAGRTETAKNSAPAVNATIEGANARRATGAQFGSGRSGGTAAANETAATNTQSNVDKIINANLVGGREAGAKGLESVGRTELEAGSSSIAQALQALGISGSAGANVAKIGGEHYQFDTEQQEKLGGALGDVASKLLNHYLFT